MPLEGEPAPSSMGQALAAIQAQGSALEALVGQAVDVGSSAMGDAGAALRKLSAAGKSAATRALNGQRRTLDQVGGPGAATAGQQLATQAEMLGLIPGASAAVQPVGGGPVLGGGVTGTGGPPVPGAGVSVGAANITQGPVGTTAPPHTGGEYAGPTFVSGPGLTPGPQPIWADPTWPSWPIPQGAAVMQADGHWELVYAIQWPCEPIDWVHRHPPLFQGMASTPYPDAQLAITTVRPHVLDSPPYDCGPTGGVIGQNGIGPPPVYTGPTIAQNGPPPPPPLGCCPSPPINITVPPPVINLTCPQCGYTSPIGTPPPPPPPLPPPKKSEECQLVQLCDADRLVVHSDGSYEVSFSLSEHSEFQTLVQELLQQTVKVETDAEPRAATDTSDDPTTSELVLDPFV